MMIYIMSKVFCLGLGLLFGAYGAQTYDIPKMDELFLQTMKYIKTIEDKYKKSISS